MDNEVKAKIDQAIASYLKRKVPRIDISGEHLQVNLNGVSRKVPLPANQPMRTNTGSFQ